MSADVTAQVYTMMLNDDEFRGLVAANPSLMDKYDLTDEERQILAAEADTEVSGFSLQTNGVMGYLGNNLPLSPATGSSLGLAVNRAVGNPTSSFVGSNFSSAGHDCCPWKGGLFGGELINPA